MLKGLAVSALVVALAVGAAPASRRVQGPPERFTVMSDGHPMAVWSRRPPNPTAAVLLLHGRTWSSRPDFDLQVAGLPRSVMLSLAERGLATYALDMRGYGGTPQDATGWLTPRRSAADVLNALVWVATRHPDLPRPALVGWSRGAAVAQLAAQAAPARLSALVLFGFVFDPDATFIDLVQPEEPPHLLNTAASARADFISPDVTPPAVVDAFVDQALAADPVLANLRGDAQFDALDPAALSMPTLVLYGERDPGVFDADAAKFFARLGATDKRMVVLPGADHAAQLEDTHDAWVSVVAEFVSRSR